MSSIGHSSNSGSNVHKKLIIIISFLVVLVIASMGLIIVLLLKSNTTAENNETVKDISGGRGTVLTQDNVEEFQRQETEAVQDGYYTTSMSIDWHFDGKVSEDAYVANDVANTRTVYFDLYRTDTDEMLYSSPYIPVGAELDGLTMDTELEPGTYDTVLVYHLVDDDKNELSTLSIALTIYVE